MHYVRVDIYIYIYIYQMITPNPPSSANHRLGMKRKGRLRVQRRKMMLIVVMLMPLNILEGM